MMNRCVLAARLRDESLEGPTFVIPLDQTKQFPVCMELVVVSFFWQNEKDKYKICTFLLFLNICDILILS